jgi:hypothetical protein
MNALRKKLLFVATAGMTTWALMQAPMAQTSGVAAAKSAMEEASRKAGAPPKSSAARHRCRNDGCA